jgi:hypothetical protein
MVSTDNLLSGFMAGGIAGVAATALSKQSSTFKNVATKKVADDPTTTTTDSGASTWDGVVGIILIIALIVLVILSIIFLVAIYRMMPSYKVLHVIMTFLLGPLWYMPAFIHYCITNDYVLMSSTGGYTGANNTRGRSSNKYL